MTVIGTGYNSHVFRITGEKPGKKDEVVRLVFAGKITQKKGVKSLLRAMNLLDEESHMISTDYIDEVSSITNSELERLLDKEMDE